MIPTSIGTLQVGSPWLSRQWISSIPGVSVTPGITQNNLTIRAGHNRPSVSTSPGASGSSSSGGTSGTGGGSSGGGGISIDDGGDGDGGDDGDPNTYLR